MFEPGLAAAALRYADPMGLDNPVHILLLLIVLLLVFGAKRLPEMGRSLGEGMRGFKDALGGHTTHDSLSASSAPPVAAPVAPPAAAPVAEPVAVEQTSPSEN
jgi:sec-independent protein translocase protein TatA